MAEARYDWKNGPATIQQHSVAKHKILQSYLAAYFRTLGSSPNQDVLRLTLVDGFAGGGLYSHSDTGKHVEGSPFIFLRSTQEAEFRLNEGRHKPIRLLVDYFFVESDRAAFQHLEKTLRDKGYGTEIGRSIQIFQSDFQTRSDEIIEFIKKKSPRNGRSIFALDQYGYAQVPTAIVRKIFQNLPSAEVLLTFNVDSLLNFAGDGRQTAEMLTELGLPDIFAGQPISEIKKSDRNWRLLIQSTLYRELVSRCGARFYTPFFVRNKKGHGDYWLLHMSTHHRARDVMTEVHWENGNYFIHYGGAGLDMFGMNGYDPDADSKFKGQTVLGFEFDDVARNASVEALREDVPRLIYAHDDGMSFGELFVSTCNSSPASERIYRAAVESLIQEKVLQVFSPAGAQRRVSGAIRPEDRVVAPRQRPLSGIY